MVSRPADVETTSGSPLEVLAASCSAIVEVPSTIDLSPPYAVRYGGIGIIAKINRSMFVGAERITGPVGIEFGSIWYFVPEIGHYVPLASDRRAHLQRGLPDNLPSDKLATRIRIHVVSELPFYRGLNTDSPLAAGIAAVLLLMCGTFDAATLDRSLGLPFEMLNESPVYQALFRLAWRIELLISKNRPEGHHLHASLTTARGCTVFWRDPRPTGDALAVLLDEDPFELHPFGAHLDDLVRAEHGADARSAVEIYQLDPLLAFDFAAVFVGREIDTSDTYASHRKGYRHHVDVYTMLAVDTIKQRFPCGVSESRARFLAMREANRTTTNQPHTTTAVDSLMDLSVVKSMEIVAGLIGLSTTGATPAALRSFAVAVDRAQDIYRLLDLSSGIIDEACHVLRSELRSLVRQKVGVRLMGAGRGGCLLVVASKGTLSAALPMSLDRLRSELRLPPSLPSIHWTSFGDGYAAAGRGLRVVQDPAFRRHLSFRTARSLVIREWLGGELRSPRLYERNAWQQAIVNFDYVIDFDDEPHVWYRGKPVDFVRQEDEEGEDGEGKDSADLAVPGEMSKSPEDPGRGPAGRRFDSKRTTRPVLAPRIAKKLLRHLFDQAPSGATSVFLDSDDFLTPLRRDAESEQRKLSEGYNDGRYVRRILAGFVGGSKAMQDLGLVIGAMPGSSDRLITKGKYRVVVAPHLDVRLALVARWRNA